jgi:hypothetical protein
LFFSGLFAFEPMSKKQNPTPQIVNNYTADRSAAQTPSAAEQALSDRNKSIIDWSKSGDYRQGPKGVFFNFTDPALRQEQRKLQANSSAGGIFDLGGGGNSSLVDLNKQNIDDQFERDQAENYQNQVAGTVDSAYGSEGQLMNTDLQRKLGILGGSTSLYGQDLNRLAQQKPWWQTLMQGAAGAGAAYLSNPAAAI